jgi:hypothetical protein
VELEAAVLEKREVAQEHRAELAELAEQEEHLL